MRILGLIPARGGSKSIPGKNIRPLAGKSLIQRAHETAVASGLVDRVVLSTDDEEIADVARRLGIEVPFMRPAQFATDESPMIDVAVHALETLGAASYFPDALLLLQPTSPLRRVDHIRRAVEALGDGDAVCSVVAVPRGYSPHYLMRITADRLLEFYLPDGSRYTRRQDVPLAYKRDGTIFLTRTAVLLGQRSFYGERCVPLLLDPQEVLNIDDPEEWQEAERRLRAVE